MANDKRELLLVIKGKDQGAKRALDDVGDAAEGAKDDLQDMNLGLKKLDGQIADSTKKVEALRREIAKSGDLGLVKDLERAQRELNKLTKQRKLVVPVELDVDKDSFDVGDLVKLGGKGAGGFAVGFSQKIGPLLARAPVTPQLLTAVAAAAPLISAAVSGAVTTGVALAGVGAGLKIAFTNPEVQAAGDALGKEIGDGLKDAAKPFGPAVIDSIGDVRREFRRLKPELDDLFADSARYVGPLTDAALGFTRELVPGLKDANRNAEPLIRTLGEHGPKAGKVMSDALRRLSEDSENTAAVLDGLFTGIEFGANNATKAMQGLNKALPYIGPGPLIAIGELGDPKVIGEWVEPVRELGGEFGTLAERNKVLNSTLNDGIKAAGGFKQALDLLNGGAISAEQAWLNYQGAIDDFTAGLKEHGKTLNANTEAGRANRQNLLDIATAAQDSAQAIYDKNVATRGAAVAEALAGQAYAAGREQLIKSARQAGLSEEAARKYADQVMKTPKNWATWFSLKNVPQAMKDMAAYKAFIATIPREVYTYFNTPGLGAVAGFGKRKRAMGGPVEADQTYLVGERGPELFTPARSGQILPAHQTKMIAASANGRAESWASSLRRSLPAAAYAGGGGPAKFDITIRWPNGEVAGRIVSDGMSHPEGPRAIQNYVTHNGGGDVQATFGRGTSRNLFDAYHGVARH